MAVVACWEFAMPSAGAQTAKDLVGSWTLESDTTTSDGRKIQPFGTDPNGIAIFDGGGHFAIVNSRPDCQSAL
jgi:Lipocalin-like domain